MKAVRPLTAVIVFALLAACGGGGGDEDVKAEAPPDGYAIVSIKNDTADHVWNYIRFGRSADLPVWSEGEGQIPSPIMPGEERDFVAPIPYDLYSIELEGFNVNTGTDSIFWVNDFLIFEPNYTIVIAPQ